MQSKKMSVIVIEDDIGISRMLQRVLEMKGHRSYQYYWPFC